MARTGIIFGLLLCGVTFLGLVGTPLKSPTQFIPMMLGIPILFCGVVALNPHRRKHAMHVAAAVALLGAVAGAARIIDYLFELGRGDDIDFYSFKLVVTMTLLCTVFVLICVRSFINARRRKSEADAAAARATINLHKPTGRDDAAA